MYIYTPQLLFVDKNHRKKFPRQMRSFMPILLPSSSFKPTASVVIAGVFSVAAAIALIVTVPSVSHFMVSYFPIIYDNTVFVLKPPYLYLVINCIIVSIVATSKLTQKSSSIDDSDFLKVVTPVTVVPVPPDIDTGYLNVVHVASDYTGFVEKNDVRDDAPVDLTVEDVRRFPEVIGDDKVIADDGDDQQTETEKPKPSSDSPEKPKPKSDSSEISILKQTRKPPRFGQQKTLKASSEEISTGVDGNKKSALGGASKPPRRQDTMETTWEKITEGRSTPLTKHLTKSDTWQERSHVQSSSDKKMTKSETLNDRNAPTEERRKTRLKREPSPGQEELNRRVEAFIKKFNEEMKLQRLESLAKYNEMVNGRTRL